MTKIKAVFHSCTQDSQELGSNQHMVSRLFLSIIVEGKSTDNLHVDIKQTVGADYASGPLEVGNVTGYRGPFNHAEFQRAAEAYYRKMVGASGGMIRVVGGSGVRMRNNIFMVEMSFEFEGSETAGGW
jgi:hypothetical protein